MSYSILGRWTAAGALLGFVFSAAAPASAANIRWEGWGKGREVAAGKMVKWSINKSGQLYMNFVRSGSGWTECPRPNNFYATKVAAHGSQGLAASDNRRVIVYDRNLSNGRCEATSELAEAPVLVRDLAYDGQTPYMLGEDGEVYFFDNRNWRLLSGGKSSMSAVKMMSSMTSSGKNKRAPGKVLCTLPTKSKFYILTDAKHGRGLIAGNRSQPEHNAINRNTQPYDDEAVWNFEKVEDACLFRLRDSTNPERYLVAGDSHDNQIYLQPHQDRTNAMWRLVSGEDGRVMLVDYKHGRALVSGQSFDGSVYHQDVEQSLVLRNRPEQWWTLHVAQPLYYEKITKGPACKFPQDGIFRLDDAKHRKSLRWKDGNHGDGYRYEAAEWRIELADRKECSVWLVSRDGSQLFAAGDGYDGRIYAKPNNPEWRAKANARWRFDLQRGGGFTITDVKHGRQLVAGDRYDGKIHHQEWNRRKNGLWTVFQIKGRNPQQAVVVTGDGKPDSIAEQPMRISADPDNRRLWFAGSGHGALYVDLHKNSWSVFKQDAVDIHVSMNGMPWFLSADGKIMRPRASGSGNGSWKDFESLTSGIMRFDVDMLGYPVAIQSGNNDQILHTFPGRDDTVPGASSCKPKEPFSWVALHAKAQYGKLEENISATLTAIRNNDLKGAAGALGKIASQGSPYGQVFTLAGALTQEIPQSHMKTIGKLVEDFGSKGTESWARAVAGDIEEIHNLKKDVLTNLLKGDVNAAARRIYETPVIKDYLVGPIFEVDWSQDPFRIYLELRVKYTLRAWKLKGELSKYTPAGAAKYGAGKAAEMALKEFLAQHGPEFAKKELGLTGKELEAFNKVIFLTVQGYDEYMAELDQGIGSEPSGLYTEARVKPAKAEWVWSDRGSGGDNDGSFWRPRLDNPKDCISLGDYIQSGYDEPRELRQICNARKGKGVWWEYPEDFDFVWSDRCSGAKTDGSIWMPRCPVGFTAVGFVTNNTSDLKPWPDSVACLKASPSSVSYVDMEDMNWVWNDRGSGATFNVEIFNRDFGGVPLMYAYPDYMDAAQAKEQAYWRSIAPVGDAKAAQAAIDERLKAHRPPAVERAVVNALGQ